MWLCKVMLPIQKQLIFRAKQVIDHSCSYILSFCDCLPMFHQAQVLIKHRDQTAREMAQSQRKQKMHQSSITCIV